MESIGTGLLLIILTLVFVIYVKANFPRWKGKVGESFVTEKLRDLDPAFYKIFTDVLLPSDGNIKTTQIDQLVVSKYGIFCIETKNYSGWIFGSANQEYWTQVIYRNKERFYNPLWQNYAHTKAVEELLKEKYPKLRIYSLVAFPSADKIKVTGTDFVGYASDVLEKIVSFNNIIFSDSEVEEICAILSSADIKDEKSHEEHDKEAHRLND